MHRLASLCVVVMASSALAQLEAFSQPIPGTAVAFEMVPIPAGSITLADPAKPGETVTVEVPAMWIGKFEVTWDEYDIYTYRLDLPDSSKPTGADGVSRPSKPYLPPDRGFGHAGYPAISIAYPAAQQYCDWLSAKTGKTFRLPTEAQWEYACRAGAATAWTCGDDESGLADFAWYAANAEGKTEACGTRKPNAWGVFDMHGNAAEWTAGLDGKGVMRGGSYRDAASVLASAARQPYKSGWQTSDPQVPKSKWWLSDGPHAGFRIVCIPPASDAPPPGVKGE